MSRRTIARWYKWLVVDKFIPYAFRLKSKVPWLGRYAESPAFWSACLDKMELSEVMLLLNNLGVIIP